MLNYLKPVILLVGLFISSTCISQQTIALVEQFVGHKCSNCIPVHEKLDSLKNHYQDSMVYVNFHQGTFAIPAPGFPADYTTPEADTFFDYFELLGVPMFLANRMDTTGSFPTSYGSYFSSSIDSAIAGITDIPSPVDMTLAADYSPSLNMVFITVQTMALQNLMSDYNVVLYIVEDSIVSPQADQFGGTVTNYMHRNVFRGTVNGTWGTTWGSGVTNSTVINLPFTFIPDPAWDISNLRVLAYIRDINTERVIQVAYKSVDTPVSIENNALARLNAYPNPTSNRLRIIMPKNIQTLNLQLHDLSGRLVKELNVTQTKTIDVSSLSNGVYTLSGSDDLGNRYAQKLVIN